jgi:hypothetical protein
MLVAARYPELVVGRLVMVEATPNGPSLESIDKARRWFGKWPRPLAQLEVVTVPSADHDVHLDTSQRLADLLDDFLKFEMP